ncbi:MAG: hypothetical protein INQ03_26010 [Candidatus Heimdallarchaeota archaeon]|nr:hypothetical protein [Candidatus Heimdallarchaeota archaeon]
MTIDLKSLSEREKQRLHDAYLMGLRARNFSSEELIKQADQLISFSRKLHASTNEE